MKTKRILKNLLSVFWQASMLTPFLLFTSSLYTEKSAFQEFIEINKSFLGQKNALLFHHSLEKYTDGKLQEKNEVYDFFYGSSQLILIQDGGEEKIILSTPYGYWIQSIRLRSALKISGNFKAQGMDVQDLFRIDFEHDYRPLKQSSPHILLERTSSKMSYPFVKIEKSKNYFEAMFMDRNQKPLKKLRYYPSFVNGYYCFSKVEVNDLIFNRNQMQVYSILSIRQANLPLSFFSSTNMMRSLPYFKNL